ncbi:NUDIX hydrolase [Galbibacter sp. BG1]|uniref:NUDIX hydrolase n=1 Tax=Galbibacter sp. BG1 TaxID=1170699 RepID=UPI0015B86A47|nr:NUDIX hydrolase [Galbibacter sp. BG1]QLE02433.1 NUDIX hydrolase [Galbibacter sp. BG1]
MNKLKIFLIFFVLNLFFTINSNAQQRNFSYFKLCVTNSQNEILLVKYKGIWELAGKKYVDTLSIKQFTAGMAGEMGVNIKDTQLRGLFTFYYNDAKYPIIFNYYSAQYHSGDLVVPPGCSDIAWFSLQEALEIIPFKTMTMSLQKMFEKPSVVWGGSFHIEKSKPMKIDKVKMLEDFYPLSR